MTTTTMSPQDHNDAMALGISEQTNIESDAERIQQGTELSQSLTELNEAVGNEEVTDGALKTPIVCAEALRIQSGSKRSIKLAVESYSFSAESKKSKLVAEITSLAGRVERQTRLAQEGLFDRITNAFERNGTSIEQLVRDIPTSVEAMPDNAGSSLKIKAPIWAKVFYTENGNFDVKTLENVFKRIQSSTKDLSSAFNEGKKLVEKAKKGIGDEDNAVGIIEQAIENFKDVIDGLEEQEPTRSSSKMNDVAYLSKTDAQSLLKQFSDAANSFEKLNVSGFEKYIKEEQAFFKQHSGEWDSAIEDVFYSALLPLLVSAQNWQHVLHLSGFALLKWVKTSSKG